MTLTIDALLIPAFASSPILLSGWKKLAKTVEDYKHYYLALSREIGFLLMLRRHSFQRVPGRFGENRMIASPSFVTFGSGLNA